MINIRKYKESDAPALWKIFYHTIHNVNIRDYSKAQVEAWAPDEFDPEIWQRKMNFILPFVAEIEKEYPSCTLRLASQPVHSMRSLVLKLLENKSLQSMVRNYVTSLWKDSAKRIRLDCESGANHNLNRLLNKPGLPIYRK